MSRIGKQPVPLPDGVQFQLDGLTATVTGPKGTLVQRMPRDMTFEVAEGAITVRRPTDRPQHRALHGLARSLVSNMVEGVTKGFEKRLEIVGVGYRFVQNGPAVDLSAGFSHPVKLDPPEGITYHVIAPNQMSVSGNDRQLVGQMAAEIRRRRPPEPYKGKGIKYQGEHVRRKVGKRAQ